MKILVTGDAGYIGQKLVPTLLNAFPFCQITGVDNLRYKQTNHNIKYYRYKGLYKDVTSYVGMYDLYCNHDIIIPLAALVGAPICDKNKEEAEKVNHGHIKSIINTLNTRGLRPKIIYPNTNSGYGIGGSDYCTEKDEMNPISVYGKTKMAGEKTFRRYSDSTILRLATVFGISPRMRFDLMVNDFIAKLYLYKEIDLYEPRFRRNFVHINDVCRAIVHMIRHNYKGVFNCGLDEANMTKYDLAEKISNKLPFSTKINICHGSDPDKRDYIVSNDKIKKTGFEFKYGLDSGIYEIVQMFSWGGYTENNIKGMRNC